MTVEIWKLLFLHKQTINFGREELPVSLSSELIVSKSNTVLESAIAVWL